MSSNPPNKWLTLTAKHQATSAPQQETHHTHIPLTRPRATSPNFSALTALNQTPEAEEADNASDMKKAVLQKDMQVITEQLTKLKALAKRIRRLRGLEESDDEEVTWMFQQLLESAKRRPERMGFKDQLAVIVQDG